jgi:hypothetical protein
MRVIYTALAAAAVALALTAAASSMAPPKLVGTVGPGFTISLKHLLKPVRALKAGRYTIVVTDKSSIHNFRLKGPGLNRAITTTGGTGTKTVTVRLKAGRYTFVCDSHPTIMIGHFTVA